MCVCVCVSECDVCVSVMCVSAQQEGEKLEHCQRFLTLLAVTNSTVSEPELAIYMQSDDDMVMKRRTPVLS